MFICQLSSYTHSLLNPWLWDSWNLAKFQGCIFEGPNPRFSNCAILGSTTLHSLVSASEWSISCFNFQLIFILLFFLPFFLFFYFFLSFFCIKCWSTFCFHWPIFHEQIKLFSYRSQFWDLRRKSALIFSKGLFFQNSLVISSAT